MIKQAFRVFVTALTIAVIGGIGLAGTAHADSYDSEGRVTAHGGLVVRSQPTTASARVGILRLNKVVPLSCKITGTVVYRNNDQNAEKSNIWYRLPASSTWVSALYIDGVTQAPPDCGSAKRYQGRVITGYLNAREAPTTRANAHGGYMKDAKLTIVCKLESQSIDGNNLWYSLPTGTWVAARYVANIGAAPGYCVET